ncbi:hypothetical protein [uncultured Methanomethylovorans sp.]|uniref:hypothetical protein n=1 Tax=uncultured Methanomethylovorans sp. TaxID=183759 RepID=UPI002AA5E785|nr:hypothetical protein [uncultured Methanomethylovorans sp.]
MVIVTDLKNKLEDGSGCTEPCDGNDAGDQSDVRVSVTTDTLSSSSARQVHISESNDDGNLPEKTVEKTSEEKAQIIYDAAAFQLIQQKLAYFEERFSDIQVKLDEGLSQNSGSLNALKDEMSSLASNRELSKLRKEFDSLHKKLSRVAREEDALSGQSLNAAKVPPDVLQITYSKTLNDLYGAMLNIYGDNESEAIINTIRDNVRGFSAGVDFFRFEEGSFLVTELSEAIQSRLVSTKQIHGTYIEIFKRMAEYAPNYESQDFRSFVETGSREYAVEKIAEHNHRLKDLESLVNKYLQELDNVSENMGFVAQLQNQQLEEIKAKSDDIINIKDQISSLSHAVNLHTRLFKKLNSNLETIRSQLELIEASSQNNVTAQEIISMSSDISQAVPSQPEIAALATSLNDLREQTSVMVSELYSRVDSVFSNVHGIEAVSREVASLQEQLQKLRSDMQEDVMYIDLNDIDDIIVHESETAGFESDLCIDLNDIHEFTGVVVSTLGVVGPSTLKQLNKALFSSEVKLDEEELMQVLDEAISSGLVTSQRKGRYLYYNVNQA